MMLKLHLQDPRHHSYTPSLPLRGQSCCLMHSTTSHSLRLVIGTTVIYAICCVQTIYRCRQSSSYTHAASIAEFLLKIVASGLHILFVNIALFLQKQLGKLTG